MCSNWRRCWMSCGSIELWGSVGSACILWYLFGGIYCKGYFLGFITKQFQESIKWNCKCKCLTSIVINEWSLNSIRIVLYFRTIFEKSDAFFVLHFELRNILDHEIFLSTKSNLISHILIKDLRLENKNLSPFLENFINMIIAIWSTSLYLSIWKSSYMSNIFVDIA